jgi:hypothetical protein
VSLIHLSENEAIESPIMVVAFDGWVDAGSASTTAGSHLAANGEVVATIDADAVFDYRARRPTLDIRDGRPSELAWPELALRHRTLGAHELLVLVGPEPDYRWQELAKEVTKLAKRLGVAQWISLGAIPAAVPHTRPVPILGTESRDGLLRADVRPGPTGLLRVPAAALSALDMAISSSGIPALGYFAQIPHYISGPYPTAAMELLRTVGRHLGEEVPLSGLEEESQQMRVRLDAAIAVDETTRAYVERLEAMVDEARLPSGDELISDIERFLRDRGTPGNRLN